jgi:penicillin-binding protein 1A
MTVQKIVKEKSNSVDIASGLVNSDYQLFVDMVIQDVQAKTGESPYTTGMEIYTTLDPKLQKHVSNIFNGKTYKWANKKVQGGVAVVDVKTGAIAAIGGGRNVSSATSYNRAIHIKRQIGSTAKPLYDYGPAIEYLNWNTGTIIADDKTTYSDGTAIHNWDGSYTGYQTIEQHLKVSRNIPALKTFKAVPKADIIKFVTGLGLTPEIYSCDSNYKLSGKKCINKENANDVVDAKQATTLHEAHSIGGYNGESPLTMAAAYAAFGNGGYYNEPYSFTKVVHTDTGDTYFNKPARRQVMSDSTAYMITHMLQETAAYGIDSGSYKNVNGIRYAAKTGTTNFDDATKRKNKLPGNAINDYWVIGYNTEYAIGVWYGYDSIKDGYQVLGGSQHQRLFQAVAQGVFKSKADFPMPSSVVKVVTEKDTATSLLPSAATPSSYKVTSLFISGTEPNKVSTRFDSLSNISNLNAENNGDGTITVSWSGIGTPNVFDVSYVASNLSKQGLPTTNLNSYASSIVSRNKKFFGSVGYRVYVEENGTLVDKGFTPNNSITVSTTNGTHKVTVKAAYSNYSGCMSSGRTTSVTVTGSGSFEPEPTEPEQPTTDDSNKTSNSNSNITRP